MAIRLGKTLPTLLEGVSACTICAPYLPHGTRPVVQVAARARILIAGQAPGRRVHQTGVPFDDPSGERLREWMGIGREVFYDPDRVAILPMGFCYPGSGSSGDLPPRPECAPAWRAALLEHLASLELTLVIGQYAQAWHLGAGRTGVTKMVRDWRSYWPLSLPLPHPSPRNRIWVRKNPWFEEEVLPALRRRVAELV
jgi:uracil-DNA glycosylase